MTGIWRQEGETEKKVRSRMEGWRNGVRGGGTEQGMEGWSEGWRDGVRKGVIE